MSATPSASSAGNTPNGTAPRKVIIRQVKADPMVRRKPNKKPPFKPAGSAINAINKPNGVTAPKPNLPSKPQQNPSVPPRNAPKNSTTIATTNAKPTPPPPPKDPHGFSEPPQSEENTYYWPLYTTKRDIIQGLRFHVAKFASKKNIDPTDEQVFTRPVRLHRRDPRAPPGGAGGEIKNDPTSTDSKDGVLDDKEREQQEIARQEREAQRQADLAQIAPTTRFGAPPKKTGSKKQQNRPVYRPSEDPAVEKASKLRYEESMPWHLEDFDNKNIWVGNYESALSELHVGLTVGQSCFNVVPLEKWYKFTPKNQFNALTIEEAEARMKAKVKEPRWFMESRMAEQVKKEEEQNKNRGNKLFLGKWEDSHGGRAGIPAHKSEFAEVDDLDYEEDRFADDEEPTILEGEEEDAKIAEERIKRDQLKANVFDLKEEQEYDREAEEEKKENELEKKLGKGLKKALMKREKNYIYDDDSDGNPYSEGSDSDDSDEERRKEEERKKEEKEKAEKQTAKDKEKEKEKAEKQNTKDKEKDKEGSKNPSGASTKGTNTPSGKPKHLDAPKKAVEAPKKPTAKNLKRAASPDPSEVSVSGAEAARKKPKKKHNSSQPTATSTPVSGSRATSPAPPTSVPDVNGPRSATAPRSNLSVESNKPNDTPAAPAKNNKKRPRPGAGSGSDGDATGAEMSDNAQRNNAKRPRPSPKAASPRGSRAGSPNPPPTGRQGSRAGSPNPPPTGRQGSAGAGRGRNNNSRKNSRAASPAHTAAGSPSVQAEVPLPLPSEAEIIASIPAEGTTITELLEKFKRRVQNNEKTAFIDMVKKHSYLSKETKKLLPRPTGRGAGGSQTPTSA
ncbi:MAG: hypothetical protein M1816_000420 [Peltula sp. TS41687]|nr:MAG: hypothetical protein M1816_000420 [Peltula sp. TS41687]